MAVAHRNHRARIVFKDVNGGHLFVNIMDVVHYFFDRLLQLRPDHIGNVVDGDIQARLDIIERTLKVQKRAGASHLQQIEMSPLAYGHTSADRKDIKKLRKQRNLVLIRVLISVRAVTALSFPLSANALPGLSPR